ncbi:LysR family transcriptional regulator [Streptomyces sp. CBMA156]|uniref:LysR family transcriptional regulator n=1 Tax=Streptomyces sp. CBMA156 TaxID=1930280 RepID=UPI001661FADA|nr:LysR family transcriptional regulator [Streptomyces sp. CBMA156]MBD0675008.1 LysR family transcriptional regulator [Streptomyces sp. CBMA156]
MELRQLRVFEAVVTHRTVTGAAVALGLAPSSVSEQVRTLELSLGTDLFDRARRDMTLTSAGERLLPWSRRLLDQAEQARREVVVTRARLRLGVLAAIAATHLPAALARLTDRRPGLDISLHTEPSRDALLAGVAAGALEAALILDLPGPLGALGFPLPPAPLDHRDLQHVPLALVAAPTHPLARATTLTRENLRGHRLLVDSPACSYHLAGERLLGHHVRRLHTGAVPVTRACAEQGLGIALLPASAVHDRLTAGTLTRLPLDPPPLHLRLFWRTDHEPLPGLRDATVAAMSGSAPFL